MQGGWKLSNVTRKTLGDVAVLTIKRPKVLNAVDTTVLAELREKFAQKRKMIRRSPARC